MTRRLVPRLVPALVLTLAACGPDRAGNAEAPPGGAEAPVPGSVSAPAPEAAGAGSVVRLDPRFDALVPEGATIERVAGGFGFVEGPLWMPEDGRLLFSDVSGNAIRQWSEEDSAALFMAPWYDGPAEGRALPGPNGLTRDAEGRIVVADHGRRQVTRIDPTGRLTPLVQRYRGMRLNSPNDLVYRSDGWLYFTDPPYGIGEGDQTRELDFSGVYRLSPEGELELLTRELPTPNGIAFSPDENTLYVASSGGDPGGWTAFDVGPDGLSGGRTLHDGSGGRGDGVPDGLKVDERGNLFATGPGGVWVIAPDGTHLGTIRPDEIPANVAWGGDGSILYMTARTGLYRIPLSTRGAIP